MNEALKASLDRFGALVEAKPKKIRHPRPTLVGGQCASTQYGGEMYCAPCGLRYGANEPDPPICPRTNRLARCSGRPGA